MVFEQEYHPTSAQLVLVPTNSEPKENEISEYPKLESHLLPTILLLVLNLDLRFAFLEFLR